MLPFMEKLLPFLSPEQHALVLGVAVNLVIALAIVIVGRFLASQLGGLVQRTTAARSGPTVAPLLGSVVKAGVSLIALVAALSQVGIDTSSLLALVGAAGLAIGLALKDTLSDLAAGVILLIFRPFDVGEAVDVDGKMGVVSRMNLFTVDITTFEGVPLVLPNSSVRGAPIHNFSRAQVRRTDLLIGVSYDADLKTAIEVLKNMLETDPRVLSEPEAIVNVDSLGDSDVRLLVRYHCAAADFLGLKMDMTRGAKEGLEAAGISIPFPQREIKVVGAEKLSAA